MLRISRRNEGSGAVRLKLEGKLDAARVPVLDAECRELVAAGRAVELDLTCLRFADADGLRSLRRLRASGVRLSGATPLVDELLRKDP